MFRRRFASEDGFTLLETVASMILISALTLVAFGLIQSTDHLMRYSSTKADVARAERSAVEYIKQITHDDDLPIGCDGAGGDFQVDSEYWATYTCTADQKGISRLYQVELTIREGGAAGNQVGAFSLFVTRGGY